MLLDWETSMRKLKNKDITVISNRINIKNTLFKKSIYFEKMFDKVVSLFLKLWTSSISRGSFLTWKLEMMIPSKMPEFSTLLDIYPNSFESWNWNLLS